MITRRTAIGLAATAISWRSRTWRRGDAPLQVNGLGAARRLTVEVQLSAPGTIRLGGILRVEPGNGGGLRIAFRTDAKPAPLQLWVPPEGRVPGDVRIRLR